MVLKKINVLLFLYFCIIVSLKGTVLRDFPSSNWPFSTIKTMMPTFENPVQCLAHAGAILDSAEPMLDIAGAILDSAEPMLVLSLTVLSPCWSLLVLSLTVLSPCWCYP